MIPQAPSPACPEQSRGMPHATACSLWITIARTDVPFMMHTIPHIVRTCNYPFTERVLAVDTAPLSGDKPLRPGAGTLEELRANCSQLLTAGVMDRMVDIDYSPERIRAVYGKHLGNARIKTAHNWKGYPVYGSMWCIEESKTEYFVHFDSDMLLYQQKDWNWITKGVEILQSRPEILYVRPQAGPQEAGTNLYDERYEVAKDLGGYYVLGGFGSRCFLVDKRRFEKMLPMRARWAQKQGRFKDILPRKIVEALYGLTGEGLLESWEIMVGDAMKRTGLLRADTADNKAWTLHPRDHGAEFIRKLPDIIRRVEEGNYPSGQAGRYDLELKLW
jgi:hypothetical protein